MNAFNHPAESGGRTKRMPVLFPGHGSPVNAIGENEFVRGFRETGKQLSRPRAIFCISAHRETRGTLVTAMQNPRTFQDFGGFPEKLFRVQYPAPGNPALAPRAPEHYLPLLYVLALKEKNETSREHYMPCDCVRLLTALVFTDGKVRLQDEGITRPIFDLCSGTGKSSSSSLSGRCSSIM